MNRDVLIYMNHPLRYRGETFYQAGFQQDDSASILQVVHNPSFIAPYVACVIVAAGLARSIRLSSCRIFAAEENRARMKRYFPAFVFGFAAALGGDELVPAKTAGRCGSIWRSSEKFRCSSAVVSNRSIPLRAIRSSSFTANKLLRLTNGKQLTAMQWLADTLFHAAVADQYPVFVIQNAEVLGMFGWEQSDRKYFSFAELSPFLKQIDDQGEQSDKLQSVERSAFQNAILNLRNALVLYQRLKNSVQPEDAQNFSANWRRFESNLPAAGQAARQRETGEKFDKAKLDKVAELIQRYQKLAEMAYVLAVPPSSSGQRDAVAFDW